MTHIPFDIPKAINLTDFFPTIEEHCRDVRRIQKQLRKCQRSVFLLAVLVGFSVGMIAATIEEQKNRIDELEKKYTAEKKDETAG